MCECINNNSTTSSFLSTTVNPTRNSGTDGNPSMVNNVMSNCPCIYNVGTTAASSTNGGIDGSISSSSNYNNIGLDNAGSNSGGRNNFNEDLTTRNAETLLSSSAKFIAISAIAIAQDGVINIADQGMFF